MKCIKTGCDVICDDMIYHGDLFFHNGILILSGVAKESWTKVENNVYFLEQENKKFNYHFKCEDLAEIPCYGNNACFIVDVAYDVQDEFMKQIKTYEKPECVKLFENYI